MFDMYNYRCEFQGDGNAYEKGTYTDWVTGVEKNTTAEIGYMDATCENLHILDRFVMFIEFVAFIGKNIWFIIRIRSNSSAVVSRQTSFMDVGGLQEFSLPEQLTWKSPEDNARRAEKKKTTALNVRTKAPAHTTEGTTIQANSDVETKYVVGGTQDVEVGTVKSN